MLVLTVLNFALPNQHLFVWTAIGISSVSAILVGTARNAPRRGAPWYLLAAGVACLIAGDITADLLIRVFHQPDPFPSIADVFYLTMYVLIAVGMVWLYRSGTVRREISGLLDALTLTAGVALLSWVYVIGPYVENPNLTVLEKTISIAYPLGDIMILAAGASLVTSVRATPAVKLLALGGLGLLGSDIAYGLSQVRGTWAVGTSADLGWILFYGCWGAAALHPSMRELTEPKVSPYHDEGFRRLALLGLACLIAPAVLLVEVITGDVHDGAMIAILSAVLTGLVLTRLGRAVQIQRRAVDRERALREAGAALLLATDVAGVSTVVTDAVGRLLPPRRPYRVVLNRGDHGTGPTAMRYTSSLEPGLATQLGPFEVALRSPLTAPGRPIDHEHLGVLYIGSDEATLAALQDAAQVLAGQAALAIERIRLSAEIDRRNSEAYFRTLVLNTTDVILIVGNDDRIRYASPSAATLFHTADLTGTALPDLVDRESAHEVQWRLARIRAGQPDYTGKSWRVKRYGHGTALVEASCRDLRTEPTVAGLVVTLRDVTESRRMQDELYRQATRDALTGLSNREVFVASAQQAIERASREGRIATVIVTELDDFKMVNNTMGHTAGDELLVAVGQRLRQAVAGLGDETARPMVARLGGDEFAIWVEAASQEDIDRVVQAVLSSVTEPFLLTPGAVSVTTSVGVATAIDDADAQELLRQADLAVYVAKDAGKGRSLRYEASLHSAVVDRLRLRTDLEEAVADGSFVLNYQPIVELATSRTVGFEALVRWRHPVRGLLGPGEFIGLAEESGLIVPLGGWVLHHAIKQASQWQRWRPETYVSVNVSARQLRAPGFVEQVRTQLSASGLPPTNLTLEVTESLLANERGVGEALATLRADGVRIAIDDFGTGFSSLSYLRQLPVDVLKLDKSFVDTMTSSREQHAIMKTIIQLARTLDLEVVAEGVERSEDLVLLIAMGCGFGQGYLLSRPMEYNDAVRWLRKQAAGAVATGRSAG
jgi:diguanylate cyclase (GGDEF)-like protein/PAS domain S-box-containing protein